MHSRHTIHLPSGSASNQVQPAPAQAGHLSFSGMVRSLWTTDGAYIAAVNEWAALDSRVCHPTPEADFPGGLTGIGGAESMLKAETGPRRGIELVAPTGRSQLCA
jgi:hypothetical protein